MISFNISINKSIFTAEIIHNTDVPIYTLSTKNKLPPGEYKGIVDIGMNGGGDPGFPEGRFPPGKNAPRPEAEGIW